MDDAEHVGPAGQVVTVAPEARHDDGASGRAASAAPNRGGGDYGVHPRFALVVRVAVAAAAVGIAWPVGQVIHDRLGPSRRLLVDGHDLVGAIQVGLVEVGWAVWMFTFGSMVGSFLNVVVHRPPARSSVVFGRSACPVCGTGIRPRDNVPIFGWLVLGGRCRDCGTLIDARYPLVEAALAGAFLALGYAEIVSGGATLPLREPCAERGVMWTVLHPKWDLIAVWIYHAAALALLFTWALIAAGGKRLPPWHVVGALVVMGLVPVAFPWLHPVPLVHPALILEGAAFPPERPEWLWHGLLVSLAGAVVGGAMGAAVSGVGGDRHRDAAGSPRAISAPGLASIVALVGVVFGWQAVPAVMLVAVVLSAAAQLVSWRLGGRHAIAAEFLVVLAVIVHVALWRWIVFGWSAACTMPRG